MKQADGGVLAYPFRAEDYINLCKAGGRCKGVDEEEVPNQRLHFTSLRAENEARRWCQDEDMNLFANKGSWYEQGRPRHDPRVEAFLATRYDSQATVLELGAGTGSGTRILSRVFRAVIAVEPDPSMFYCLQKGVDQERVRCLNAYVEELDPTEHSFDYLINFQATHWFYRSVQYRELFHRARKPVLDISTHGRASDPDERKIVEDCNLLFRRHDFSPNCCDVPEMRLETWERHERMPVTEVANAVCSKSWIDHHRSQDILDYLMAHLKTDAVDMTIVTTANEVLIEAGQQQGGGYSPPAARSSNPTT